MNDINKRNAEESTLAWIKNQGINIKEALNTIPRKEDYQCD